MEFIIDLIKLALAVVAAIYLGKLLTRFNLPAVLGWFLAGIIVGPYALSFMTLNMVNSSIYKVVMIIAEIFVGVMIGIEIYAKDLKQHGKKYGVITVFEALGTYIILALGFIIYMSISNKYTDFGDILILGLIIGSLGLATSPGPSLAMVDQYHAKGVLCKSLIIVAALDDILSLAIFMFTLATAQAHFSGIPLTIEVYIMLFVNLSSSIVFGLIVGYIIYELLKFCKSKTMSYIVIVGLLVIGGLVLDLIAHHYDLELSILMFGVVATFSFNNLIISSTKLEMKKEDVHHLLHTTITFFLLLFILDTGSKLEYKYLYHISITVLLFIVLRTIGKIVFSSLGSRVMHSEDVLNRYLGYTLLPYVGVPLLFMAKFVEMFEELGGYDLYINLIVGTVATAAIYNEIIAVVVDKKALFMSGECNCGECEKCKLEALSN